MKRIIFLLAAALVLASCAPSFESLKTEINELSAQLPQAVRDRDVDRYERLTDRISEIGKQIDQLDLTASQKSELMGIVFNLMMDSRNRF